MRRLQIGNWSTRFDWQELHDVKEIVTLRKVFGTKPQHFLVVLKDSMTVTRTTEFGTEPEIRSILTAGGISQSEIDSLLETAMSESDPRPSVAHKTR